MTDWPKVILVVLGIVLTLGLFSRWAHVTYVDNVRTTCGERAEAAGRPDNWKYSNACWVKAPSGKWMKIGIYEQINWWAEYAGWEAPERASR